MSLGWIRADLECIAETPPAPDPVVEPPKVTELPIEVPIEESSNFWKKIADWFKGPFVNFFKGRSGTWWMWTSIISAAVFFVGLVSICLCVRCCRKNRDPNKIEEDPTKEEKSPAPRNMRGSEGPGRPPSPRNLLRPQKEKEAAAKKFFY